MASKTARHHVYVIELDRKVLKNWKFRRANPHHDPAKPRRFGIRLRPDLYAGLNPLAYNEAQRMEVVLARELRNDGWAVWQK